MCFFDGIGDYDDKIPHDLLDTYQTLVADYDDGEKYIVIGSHDCYSIYEDDDFTGLIKDLFNMDEEIAVVMFTSDDNDELDLDRIESGSGVIYIGTVEEIIEELS